MLKSIFTLFFIALFNINFLFANINNQPSFDDFDSYDFEETSPQGETYGLMYSEDDFASSTGLQHKIIYDPLHFINEPLYYSNYHLFSSAEYLIKPFYGVFEGGEPSSNSFVYLSNPIKNLGAPVSTVNFLLMGKFKIAGLTASAFVINTTIGVLGIFNASEHFFNISADYDAQFGITAVYYTDLEGFYTFLPVMGPNHLSDLLGFGVDLFFDPIFYFAPWVGVSLSLARRMESYFSSRAGIDLLISLSTDEYLGSQSLYYQKRRLMVDLLRKDEYIKYYENNY